MDSQVDTQHNSQIDAFPIAKRKRIEVLPAIPTDLNPNDMFYSMRRPERGLAIVFNHEFYDEVDGRELQTRHGTCKDVEKLTFTFSELGFQIDVQENLTYEEIINHVQQIAGSIWTVMGRYKRRLGAPVRCNYNSENLKKAIRAVKSVSQLEELKNHDCLVVIVLTHGEEQDAIFARDRTYSVKELVQPFVGKNCLSLANKPKLFFIQACKGEQIQKKINLVKLTDGSKIKNANKRNTVYSIPSNSDVLVSYATLEGYIALRDPTWGTPYIYTLCEELEKYGGTLDILTILTRVHHTLATSTFKIEGSAELIKVQPSFLSYLNRFVKFDVPDFLKARTQP